MEELFNRVITGVPMQELRDAQFSSPEYTILSAQVPSPEARIETLQQRLQTSTETSSARNVSMILNTCIVVELDPDTVEAMVEKITPLAMEHLNWPELLKWVCALTHYYCTDEMTLSVFSEFGVPQMAAAALREYTTHPQVALAATTLLSHFNMYDMGDGVTHLCHVLQHQLSDKAIVAICARTLAEFTSYCKDMPDNFAKVGEELVAAGGMAAIEQVLREYAEDQDITTYCANIVANVTSSGVPHALDSDSPIVMYLADALGHYQQSELLCSHVMRVFSNVPRSQYIDWDCISSLFSNTDSELVVLECIHFLVSVATNAKEMKSKIYSTGCVPRVLEMMRLYENNSAIQEEACGLLSYLSFDSETITTNITDSGGILLILNAMRKFPRNEELLMAACAALSGITFNNQAGQQVMVDNEGVGLILNAMRHGTKARLQENGCLAIGTMCWNSDLKADVVRLGGVKVIMKALDEHYTSPGLMKNACRALAQVAFNCERYRDEMSASGVIPLIIRGMEQHPNYDRAQMHGCVALSYLSWTNEGNAAQITANRGYKAVVEAMRCHPGNYEVQEHACRALANISNVNLEDSAAALEQIVAAMRRHEKVSEVQEEACRAMVTLSLVSPANKDRLYELKGADAVVAALRNFPDIQLVQQEACNALAHLAYEHANLNRAVTELHGVALLLDAMRRHPHSPKVQLNACGGLSALAFDNPTAQQQIFELGGVKCVIQAMEGSDRLRMLELGCSVLGTLAWNTDIKELVAVDAIPEILSAMRIHEKSALLQKSTCRAISQFAFNSENNRQLLADSGAIPLIVHAMRTHLGADKLILHALKALTYLCWENTQVAEKIIAEGIEEVLQQVVEYYAGAQRLYNEAVHLSKILFRKTTGSPSPNLRLLSPPMASPQSILYTPGPLPGVDPIAVLSPPMRDRDADDFYASVQGRCYEGEAAPGVHRGEGFRGPPHPGGRGRARGGGGGRGGGRGRGRGQPHADPVDERFVRPPHHRGGGGGGASRQQATQAEDLWDDPEPNSFFGNRELGRVNWQQAQQAEEQSNGILNGNHNSNHRTNSRGGGAAPHGPPRGGPRRGGGGGGRGRGGERGGGAGGNNSYRVQEG